MTTRRILKVKSAIREAIKLFWLSRQSWRVWCSFGTTSSPSAWRLISFGNQSGISWRACISFNATCPLRISFCFFSLVSMIWFPIFLCSFFHRSIGRIFDRDWVLEDILCSWTFVKSTHPAWKVEGTYFASSNYDFWGWCIREWVQPILPISRCIDWYLKVILTLRTWTVWDRNQFLSIILPILYTLCWGSSLVLEVRYHSSITCKWKFRAQSCLSGWFIV